MRVLVLTTSYPRHRGEPAGRFVADSVEQARASGLDVRVVSPANFRHFGLAYGHGVVGNLRARPWLAFVIPFFLLAFRRAAARLADDVDVVHAHWLVSGAIAGTLRKPFVVQVWGTDVELAQRVPWLVGWIFRRARVTVAASPFLAAKAEALGARRVVVVPSRVTIPLVVREPAEPPHVLFVGRLSSEKGILEFLEATEGLPRVVVGDGPLRKAAPEAVGFIPPAEITPYYERAAIVCCPSRREGYGMVAREAMACGRPVVATAAGGLVDAIEDGVNGMLVPVGDVRLLRAALVRLIGDPLLRMRLGAAARESMQRFDAQASAALPRIYREAATPG